MKVNFSDFKEIKMIYDTPDEDIIEMYLHNNNSVKWVTRKAKGEEQTIEEVKENYFLLLELNRRGYIVQPGTCVPQIIKVKEKL